MSGSYCERCGRLIRCVWYREKDGSITLKDQHICTNPETGWIGFSDPSFSRITGEQIR